MQVIKNLISLSEYCHQNEWPRKTIWRHWIYSKKPIAVKCVKKIGGKYFIDLKAFQDHIESASLEERRSE